MSNTHTFHRDLLWCHIGQPDIIVAEIETLAAEGKLRKEVADRIENVRATIVAVAKQQRRQLLALEREALAAEYLDAIAAK